MHLTKSRLYADLHRAYLDARRHKRGRGYQQRFERDMYWELQRLCDELYERRYRPEPSTCFIIEDPKKREVFAAEFRDRIVHHLYYNYTHELYERTFTADAYSCIKRRGTHYGIHRLEHHIRSESRNYTRPCYVMKMDLRGYFMNIDRRRLLVICRGTLERMRRHRVGSHAPQVWDEVLDFDFLHYLTEAIVLLDPLEECRRIGWPAAWAGLPESKSLFCSPEGCGLPIGNLTSQLFSNVYLNVLDQWMKREMGCRHYGRYVDDFYVVSSDRQWLRTLLPRVREFLLRELGLTLHEGKTQLRDVRHGVEYLGAYLKPWRMYVGSGCLRRMRRHIAVLGREVQGLPPRRAAQRVRCAVNSYLGVLSHYASYNLRRDLFLRSPLTAFAHRYGSYAPDLRSFAGEACEGS